MVMRELKALLSQCGTCYGVTVNDSSVDSLVFALPSEHTFELARLEPLVRW